MPTGAGSPSRTPQHGDSVERQSPLWTPASSVLVPCLLVSNTQGGVWWWMMHARGKGVLCLGLGLVRMVPQVRGGIRSILRTHPPDTSMIPRATVDVWR